MWRLRSNSHDLQHALHAGAQARPTGLHRPHHYFRTQHNLPQTLLHFGCGLSAKSKQEKKPMTRIPIAFLTEPRAPLDHGAVVALAREILGQHKFWDEHADPESVIVELI